MARPDPKGTAAPPRSQAPSSLGGAPKGRPAHLRRRRRRRLALLLGALVLLPGVIYLSRERVLFPALVAIAAHVAKGAGYDLQVDRVRGDLYGSLSIENAVLTARHGHHSLERLEVEGLTVRYNTLALFRGELGGLESLGAARVLAVVDLGPGRLTEEGSKGARDREGTPWTGALPAVDIARADLRLRLGEGREVSLRGGTARVAPATAASARQAIDVAAESFAYREAEGGLEGPLGVSGSWRAGRLELESLRFRDLAPELGGSAALGELGMGRWRAQVSGDIFGAKVEGSFEQNHGGAKALLRVDALDPGALLEAARAAAGIDGAPPWATGPWPRGTVRAEISAEIPRDGELRASAALWAHSVQHLGRHLDRFEFSAELLGDGLRIASLDAVDGPNELGVRDLSLDLSAKDLDGWLASARGRVRLEVRELTPWIAPWTGNEPALPEHRLSAVANVEAGRLRLLEGLFETPGGRVRLRRGEARLERGPAPLSGAPPPLVPHYQLEGRAEFDDLAPLTEILALGPFAGRLEGDLSLGGSGSQVTTSARLEGDGVVAAGWRLGRVDCRLDLKGTRLVVERLSAVNGSEDLFARGSLVVGPWDQLVFEDVTLRATLDQTVADLSARMGWDLPTVERVVADVRLDGPARTVRGDMSALAEGVLVSTERFDRVEVEWVATPLADGSGVDVELKQARALSPLGELFAKGSLRAEPGQLALRVAEFGASKGEYDLALEAPVNLLVRGREIAMGEARLSGSAGAIALQASGTAEGLTLVAESSELDLEPLVGRFLPAGLEARGGDLLALCELDWDGAPRRISARAAVREFRPLARFQAGQLSVAADWSAGQLEVAELTFTTDAGDRLSVRGNLPLGLLGPTLADGPLDLRLEAEVARGDGWTDLAGPVTAGALDVHLFGSYRELSGGLQLELLGQPLAAFAAPLAPLGTADLRISLGAAPSGLFLDDLWIGTPGGAWLGAQGHVHRPLDLVALLDAGVDGLLDLPLELSGSAHVPDLGWLRPMVPEVRSLSGALQVEQGYLRGTPRKLDRGAILVLEDGLLKFDSDLPALDALAGRVHWRTDPTPPPGEPDMGPVDVFEVEQLSALAGGSPLTVRGSAAPFAARPSLDLDLLGEDLLLYRTLDTTVRADAELSLAGPLDRLRVTGSVEPTSSRFTRNVNFLSFGRGNRPSIRRGRGIELFSLRSAPFSTMEFDVRVRARNPFRIDNNFVKGALRPDLRLRGTGEVPVLEGPIYLETTRIALPATRLKFTGGTILFEQDNPFVPQLNLRAETRIRGYDVNVQVLGDYDDPEVVMTSVPPLPPQDVAVLVATGQLPESALTVEGGTRTARLVAIYLAQDFSTQFLGRDEDEGSFLERFEVSTGRDVSRRGQETIEGSFLLWEAALVESGRGLITVERDVYDDVNFGLRFVLRLR